MAGDRYLISDQLGTYFCTSTIVNWIDLFTSFRYRDIVIDSLNYCTEHKGLVVNAWVIMSNHIHFIARANEPHTFSGFLRDFKKHTSKKIIEEIKLSNESRKYWLLDKFQFEARRTGRADNYKVWQDSNHAILLNSHIDIWQKVRYIHENPVKARIVDDAENYVYSSAADYAGIRNGMVRIEVIN